MQIKFNPDTNTITITMPNGCTVVQDSHPQTNELVTSENWREVLLATVGEEQIQIGIVTAVQKRLDDFAKTRNYDGILSLCTYSNSANARFASEGQYGVTVRDATWLKLHEVFADVQSGIRVAPLEYSDIEADMPELEWPQ